MTIRFSLLVALLAGLLTAAAPAARAQDTTFRTVALRIGPSRWRSLYDVFQGSTKLGSVGQDSARHWVAMRLTPGTPFLQDLSPTYTTLRLAARRLVAEHNGAAVDTVRRTVVIVDTLRYRAIFADTIFLTRGDSLKLLRNDTLFIPMRVRERP